MPAEKTAKPARRTSPRQPVSSEKNAAPRRSGRRPRGADGQPELSRELVLDCAIRIAREESLAELSMVRLARELGVAPGLVHYYIGSRDDLITVVVNEYFRERMESFPPLTGRWRKDLEAVAVVSETLTRQWRGVAAYIANNNRFRLFQNVSGEEKDWGLLFLDRMGAIFKEGGFTPAQAAMGYHLLMLFLVSVGAGEANRLMPAFHRDFIRHSLSTPRAEDAPGARYMAEPFIDIDTQATMKSGLKLLLDGFEGWLSEPVNLAESSAARKSSRQ